MSMTVTDISLNLSVTYGEQSVEIEACEDGDFVMWSLSRDYPQGVVLTRDELRMLVQGIQRLLEQPA